MTPTGEQAAIAAATLEVVLCDDVPELRELTRVGLELDPRVRVVGESGSAEECVEVVAEHAPQAILLDLSLPGMDGLEAIPSLREINPDVAIVIFSGFDAEKIRPVALEQGADGYVEKGTHLDEIREALIAAARGRGVAVPQPPPADVPAPATRARAISTSRPPGTPPPASAGPRGARFELLATRAPVGIYETDADGRCTFVNERWSVLSGLEWDRALGHGWTEAVHPEDRDDLLEAWQSAVDARKPFATEFRFLASDGRISWVWTEAVPLTAERGDQPLGYLGTVVDVTERHDAERKLRGVDTELRRQAAELERSNSDLDQFADIASHDLAEPLHVIRGFIELLEQRQGASLDEDGRGYLSSALGGADLMQARIDDLLTYSRVGRAELIKTDVYADAIVAEALEVLRPAVERSGARVTVGELPVVRAEPTMLASVFRYLLSNAIQSGDAGAGIEVGAEREDGVWRFRVRDDGPGVEDGKADRIFELFRRQPEGEPPGIGIGLAICRRIVERHEGRIWYEPVEGGGSDFIFTLPT